MINYTCNTPHPLHREGTSQQDRFPVPLGEDPVTGKAYVNIDERSFNDLLKQSAEFAHFIKFYNEQNLPDGNWCAFFEEIYDYNTKQVKITDWSVLEQKASTSPHLALFLTFLKIFGIAQDNLNTLKQKHLDFYYKTILHLDPAAAVPDKVAVIFEPEKNATQVLVPKGAVLKAGKDNTGVELFYKTNDDLVVNKAKVASVKTVFVEKSGAVPQQMYCAADATVENVVDATNTVPGWYTFGSNKNAGCTIGFAVASPMFNIKDGERRISFSLPGIEKLTDRSMLTVEYTSVKGWVEAVVDNAPDALQYLLIAVSKSLPAITPYNETVHASGYQTVHPVIRIKIKTGNKAAFAKAYAALQQIQPAKIDMKVNVKGLKTLILQNDLGILDPVKPFLPFGTAPVKHKSTLYIGSYDVFNKYLSALHVGINWKGIGSPKKYYTLYTGTKELETWQLQWDDFSHGHPPGPLSILDGGNWKPFVLNQNAHYKNLQGDKAKITNLYKTENQLTSVYTYDEPPLYSTQSRWGFAKIQLKYDFGHQFYPAFLTKKVLENINSTDKTVPPVPYTPEFNSLHLNYVAKGTVSFGNKEHQFFHLHPFGFAEISSTPESLIPAYESEGNIYIGFSGITDAETLSVYFQLQNDTGNPEKEINDANKITWSVLNGNVWKPLNDEMQQRIVSDTTVKFTTSGFIKSLVPSEAISAHTILPGSLVWLRGAVDINSDAYSYTVGIKTQAVEAVFDNRGNDPLHLQQPLAAATISKMQEKINGIKSLSQPFASYGGKMIENGQAYYTRISERLRHKSRSWSIYDYERMVLQEFPDVYKAKCISHATAGAEYAPGQVLMVVLPNPANINFQDPLQPRVSKVTIELIKEFLADYMSPFATLSVINPKYEPLRIVCDIKLRPQYPDEAFYSNQLKKDLAGFIAPWSVNSKAKISFGSKIYKSQIINFIEERPYVDFITTFEVHKMSPVDKIWIDELITGSNESCILTSVAPNIHTVKTTAVC
ncbi:MAG: baseplate J/gp47 family protein [Filimonas sp.]|nr:baseplate J/gp47 family protein [Filimonas sp.]